MPPPIVGENQKIHGQGAGGWGYEDFRPNLRRKNDLSDKRLFIGKFPNIF